MPRKSITPDQLDKERRVIEMRRAGATFDDIARALGFSNGSGAWQAYQRAMKRALTEAGTEEIRQLELDRLDRLQGAVWNDAMRGDRSAIQTVLKILDRRARYLGLDAPIRQEVKVEQVDPASIDAEVARLVAMLGESDGTSTQRQ